MSSQPLPEKSPLTPQQVLQYLKEHPSFLSQHPELFEFIKAPAIEHGGNVVDIQHFMLNKLQTGLQKIKSHYDELVFASRDNMSTLVQVHQSVLAIMRARELEQILEIVALDLPAVFNVDVVRIGIESEAAEFYETRFGSHQDSGITFIPTGTVNTMMKDKSVLLIADTEKQFASRLDELFSEIADLVESAVVLRMKLPSSGRSAILAFGVRIKDHFHIGQATEMLSFLAQIIEHRLDEALNDSGISELL